MRRIGFAGRLLVIAALAVFTQKTLCQSGFTIIKSWDFENRSEGPYTDEMVRQDFDVFEMQKHNTDNIVYETINGVQTKVLRVTHPANQIPYGFDVEAYIVPNTHTQYEELYMSYNFKFSDEFNNTDGGKFPGFKGGPHVDALQYPPETSGWVIKNMFSRTGAIRTYHYDRTTGNAPWGTGTYNYDSVYLNNGQWYNITRRVVMNSFTGSTANYDGIHEVWVDGKMIFKETGLRITTLLSQAKIDQVHIAHWLGGNGPYYTPLSEGFGYLDNIKVWINPNDPTLGTHNTHDPEVILSTPDEITDRTVYYDQLVTTAGTLHNTQYGSNYSPCIDEAYLIDAGAGNKVSYNVSWTIADGDGLFFYDGNRSDSRLIRAVKDYKSATNQIIASTGRYLFVRFTSNTHDGAEGFNGTLSFSQGDASINVNNSPNISNQEFIIKENEFRNNLIGKIIASDVDQGQILNYSITSGNESALFAVSSQSGQLTTTTADVFEPGSRTFILVVKVTDNGQPVKSNSANITVTLSGNTVIDIVNNQPVISDQEFVVKENEFKNNFIGKIIAYDIDSGQKLNYSIESGNSFALFAVKSQTGELTTTSTNVFDEGTRTFDLVIKVTDNSDEAKSNSANITVNLLGNSTIVYINPDNISDPTENGSASHPYDSWQDITWKSGNTYLQKRGTTASLEKILIGADNVSLGAYGEGELPVLTSQTNTYLISGYDKKNININNLHLKVDNAVSCIYFLGSNSDNIIIERCILDGNANAIRIADGKKITIKYNTVKSENEGVYSTAGTTEIYYNIFKNNKTAVNVMSKLSDANIYNNVFIDNLESVAVSYADLTLFNNIFYMTTPNQKAIKNGSNSITSDYNIFFPEQDGFIEISNIKYSKLDQLQQSLNLDLHSFNSDPLFINMLTDNYAIKPNSPAVNAGININLYKDFYGQLVPVAGNPDIGIYESLEGLSDPDASSPSLTIYPNPSSGLVNIAIQSNESTPETDYVLNQSSIKVIDLNGRTVFSKFIANTENTLREEVDLTGFSNGIYFIVLQMANKIVTQKLILN